MPANVGIIGGGNVGQPLGRQLIKKGRTVLYGSRNPSKLQQDLAGKGLDAEALSVADAVSRSDILILAVPGEAAELVDHRLGDSTAGSNWCLLCMRTLFNLALKAVALRHSVISAIVIFQL
jgi:predicted dinucleotide-binding enzyme